jgi:putative ABC transport system permease protein
MMFDATLLLALREIRRHLLRSFLTTLGIIIGVAAVITMVTLGKGVTASIREDISALGSDVYIIFPVPSDRGNPRPFEQADVDAVERQIAGVEIAAGSVSANTTAFHNGQDWSTNVQGTSTAFLSAQSIDVEEGRSFSSAEESAGTNVCLLGS